MNIYYIVLKLLSLLYSFESFSDGPILIIDTLILMVLTILASYGFNTNSW